MEWLSTINHQNSYKQTHRCAGKVAGHEGPKSVGTKADDQNQKKKGLKEESHKEPRREKQKRPSYRRKHKEKPQKESTE